MIGLARVCVTKPCSAHKVIKLRAWASRKRHPIIRAVPVLWLDGTRASRKHKTKGASVNKQEVIDKLLEYQTAYEEAMHSMCQFAVAVPTAKWALEATKAKAIATGQEAGALDGKNADERAQKLALWLDKDSETRRATNELLDMECGVEMQKTEAEIARMGVRVLETIAKLLVEG